MDALRLYMDDGNDLWINFSDDHSPYIGGPYLYCLDSETMRFKKEVRLFSDRGNPLTSVFEPQFVAQDPQGNFILATDLAYLAKVNPQGRRLYRKRLMHYDFDWTARNRKRKRPYFVRDIQKRGDHEPKKLGRGSTSSLYMMSVAHSKSRDLLFVGQGCHCCSNDVIVYNGAGKYLYHFSAPMGPEAIVARDGLLYLADSFFSLVHVYTYEGKWLRSFDVLFRDTFQGVDQDDEQARLVWRDSFQHELVDADCIASMCGVGEDKLAVGLEKGLIRLLNHDGGLIADIFPPAPGLFPNSMVADSSENLFVYYSGDGYFNKPRGLYCYGADGKNRGPLLRGELGIFQPRQKDLEKRIAEDRADAYDYFDLADIQIRRKKLSQETIRLLEKSFKIKPDLWIALAYLGLSLNELGNTDRAVRCMERAMEHVDCCVMATALIEYYYQQGDREKVWNYFKRIETIEGDFSIEFYSDKLTNDQIEQFLHPRVKRNRCNDLVSS